MGNRSHTHKQVVRFWTFATDFKQLLEVVELAVDVSADLEQKPTTTESLINSPLV